MSLTMIQLLYLIHWRPFEEGLVLGLEIMNEFFTLALMYHVLCLNLSWNSDEFAYGVVGNSFIAFVFFDVFLNFFFLFRTLYHA